MIITNNHEVCESKTVLEPKDTWQFPGGTWEESYQSRVHVRLTSRHIKINEVVRN